MGAVSKGLEPIVAALLAVGVSVAPGCKITSPCIPVVSGLLYKRDKVMECGDEFAAAAQASVDLQSNASRRTALMMAAAQGHAAITALLLGAGADADVQDGGGTSRGGSCWYFVSPCSVLY
jgi:hypothetical protein